MNNVGLVFRNERWTNWESLHVDWRWIDLMFLMARYILGTLFAAMLLYYWAPLLVNSPSFNQVVYKLWVGYDLCDYYSLYFVWILLLMRSFIWDTFIVVLLSGLPKQYYPLARREEAARKNLQFERGISLPNEVQLLNTQGNSQIILWTLVKNYSSPQLRQLFSYNFSNLDINITECLQSAFKIHYMLQSLYPTPILSSQPLIVSTNPSTPLLLSLYRNTSHLSSDSRDSHIPNNLLNLIIITQPTRMESYLQQNLFDVYGAKMINFAKQRRFQFFFSLQTPSSYVVALRTTLSLQFSRTCNTWELNNVNNIWTKATPTSHLQDLLFRTLGYQTLSHSPSHFKLINSVPYLPLSSLWQTRRFNLFDNSMYLTGYFKDLTITKPHLSSYTRQTSSFTIFLHPLSRSGKSVNFSTLEGASAWTLNTPWILWTLKLSQDLSFIYLRELPYPSCGNWGFQKRHHFHFRR